MHRTRRVLQHAVGDQRSRHPLRSECKAHSTCAATQWESKAAGTHHDRECKDHTTCTPTEWQTVAAGTLNDRECQELTTCVRGFREIVTHTAVSDRACGPCAKGQYKDRKSVV